MNNKTIALQVISNLRSKLLLMETSIHEKGERVKSRWLWKFLTGEHNVHVDDIVSAHSKVIRDVEHLLSEQDEFVLAQPYESSSPQYKDMKIIEMENRIKGLEEENEKLREHLSSRTVVEMHNHAWNHEVVSTTGYRYPPKESA